MTNSKDSISGMTSLSTLYIIIIPGGERTTEYRLGSL